MTEWIVLGLFCLSLLISVIFKCSVIYALLFGLLLFLLYGRKKNISWRELAQVSFDGIIKVKSVLITFVLIGMLTSLWRSAGTIPVIVSLSAALIKPSLFYLMAFLLNCMVSLLTGTAFGTAATMGVICASVGSSMGISKVITGGAILAGVYFGDRCSPLSTSALLVSQVTDTDIFDNIKRMSRSSFVPFLITSLIYYVMGLSVDSEAAAPNLNVLFSKEFNLSLISLIPAAVIAVLSLFKVNVKMAMSVSIISAIPIAVFLQGENLLHIPELLLGGYVSSCEEIGELLNGGGILSMLNVALIVLISSSYSGLFERTGLLENVKEFIAKFRSRTNDFSAVLLTSVCSGAIACSQTLAAMMCCLLAMEKDSNKEEFALSLEDSVIVISPLIPWSIAGAVPLASFGASKASIPFAVFLYILPLWHLLCSFKQNKKSEKENLYDSYNYQHS